MEESAGAPGANAGSEDVVAPNPACGSISPDPVEIFRSPSEEAFNVKRLVSDGTHVYLAGHMSLALHDPQPVPDPNDRLKTAILFRVPVTGGARELLDFEHGVAARGLALDAENIYWSSETVEPTLLVRAKKGGPITSFGLAPSRFVRDIATDTRGNVFWSQNFGGIAWRPAGATGPKMFQSPGDVDATWLIADAQRLYWMVGNGTEVGSAPVGGGGGDPTVLASGVGHPYSFTQDDTHLWSISNDELWKMPKDGGDRVVVATPNPGRDFRSLAVTEDAIYFSDAMDAQSPAGKVIRGPIYKAKKDGSNVSAITQPLDSRLLTTDTCRLYWSSSDGMGATVVYSRAR